MLIYVNDNKIFYSFSTIIIIYLYGLILCDTENPHKQQIFGWTKNTYYNSSLILISRIIKNKY